MYKIVMIDVSSQKLLLLPSSLKCPQKGALQILISVEQPGWYCLQTQQIEQSKVTQKGVIYACMQSQLSISNSPDNIPVTIIWITCNYVFFFLRLLVIFYK